MSATQAHRSVYTESIDERLKAMGRTDVDSRHVEAYMRLEHPTLDGLSRADFTREVKVSVGCVDASSPSENEKLALSYGL